MPTSVVRIFRIFEYDKAIEFYVEWLRFKLDWENKFDQNSPSYMQISRDGIVFHLSEHHGDCAPWSKMYVSVDDGKMLHKEICSRLYEYYNAGSDQAPRNAPCFEGIDPFSNKLLITEIGK